MVVDRLIKQPQSIIYCLSGGLAGCPLVGVGLTALAANPIGLAVLAVGSVGVVAGDENVPFASYLLPTPLEFQAQYHELNFCSVEKCSWAQTNELVTAEHPADSFLPKWFNVDWSVLTPLLLSFSTLTAGMGKRIHENKKKLGQNRSAVVAFLLVCVLLAVGEMSN